MNFSELKLEDMQLFVTVIDSDNITIAAEHLQTNTSTLSRRLKKLEENIGARLLERTTRNQQITEAGELFYQYCQDALDQFEQFSSQIAQRQDELAGRISVYAPAALFRFLIKEQLESFTKLHPQLRIEFISGAAKPHLLKDNIDILIHVDEPNDSSYVARKIGVVTTSYYASPDYLARRGEPQHPEEMKDHDCIVEINHDRIARPWNYEEGTITRTMKVQEHFSSDSVELCCELAVRGQGITMAPDFIAMEDLASGRLVRLFGDDYSTSHNIYAVYVSRRYVPLKIKAFLDFLTASDI